MQLLCSDCPSKDHGEINSICIKICVKVLHIIDFLSHLENQCFDGLDLVFRNQKRCITVLLKSKMTKMISTAELVLLLFVLSSNLILLFFSIYVSILEGKEVYHNKAIFQKKSVVHSKLETSARTHI